MKIAYAALLAAIPLLAPAETVDDEPDTLVVTATRIPSALASVPAAVVILDRQRIDASGAADLAGLLRGEGGVELLDFYGDGSRVNAGLRGFGENAASNTLILIDGVPLNNPDIGTPDLGRIVLADIERIEILHGGNAFHGNQAVGGVIQIFTRQPSTRAAELTLDAGSHGRLGARASGSVQLRDFGLRVGFSSEGRDNYREHNALERHQAHFDLSHRGANLGWSVGADVSKESLETPGALLDDERRQDRRQSADDFSADFSDLDTLALRAALGTGIGPHWRLQTALSWRRSDGEFRLSFRGFRSEPASQDRELATLSTRAERDIGAALLALGLDAGVADYRLNSQFGEQINDQDHHALWASLRTPLTANLELSSALRLSRIRDRIRDSGEFAALPEGKTFDKSRELGSLGLSWQAGESVTLFAAWDQVLRYPKVDEYFGSGFTPDTIDLRPQTGNSYNLGARLHAAALSLSVLAYRLELEDEIVFDPTVFANTNIARSRRTGAAVDLRWALHPAVTVSAALTWQDPELRSGAGMGRQLPLVARRFGRVRGDWRPAPGWSGYLEWLASAERVLGGDFDNSLPRLPGYGLINVGLAHERASWRVSLHADNLLGRRYAELGVEAAVPPDFSEQPAYFPLPERQLRLQLSRGF